MGTRLRISLHCKLRLVIEDDYSKVFYSITKSGKERDGDEQNYILINNNQIPALQTLISVTHPDYIELLYLPASHFDDKISLVAVLWEKGLVDLRGPMTSLSGEGDSEDDMN